MNADLSRTIFVGGLERLPSVRVRCIEIAEAMGCAYMVNVTSPNQVPSEYNRFICVKPRFGESAVGQLKKRGAVIWDIHDEQPPSEGVCRYLVSTRSAQEHFKHLGPMTVIPHHHCNSSQKSNQCACRIPTWVGAPTWCPDFRGFTYIVFSTTRTNRMELVDCYRRIGLGLNIRAEKPESAFHVLINPGIKLINCIGFGIPSISSDEPAYREYGHGCTIISALSDVEENVLRLQADTSLYEKLKKRCDEEAWKYDINKIAQKYKTMLDLI